MKSTNLTHSFLIDTIGGTAIKPPTLKDLLDELRISPNLLDQTCSDEHLREISLFLDWRGVAPHLGLNERDIDHIESKRTEPVKSLETLQMWKRKYGFRAKFKMLLDVLMKIGNAEQAEKVCRILRAQVYSGISLN